MKLYLLVGNAHTRKASVARALTGGFNRSLRDIQLASGSTTLRLYMRAGTLQQTKTTAEAFIAEAKAQRCDAVLACLWPQADAMAPELYPDAASYLAQFRTAGWLLARAAVLGQNSGGLKGAAVLPLPFSSQQAINVSARAVRAHFGWV